MVLLSTVLLLNMFCTYYDCSYPKPMPAIKNEISDRSLKVDPGTAGLGRNLRLRSRMTIESDQFYDEQFPVVVTNTGVLQGYRMSVTSGRKIFAFEGIPYAESPGGNNRFKNPRRKRPWRGLRKAFAPGSDCLQLSVLHALRVIGDEDCLFLNVYTPQITTKKKLPVIVFIHGGSFIFGSGRDYGPAYLLNQDVILVTLNYRLGILGFLSTGDEAASGNYGLKDQAEAIRWVHENIESFGGNSSQITIMGQSAGAASVHLQMLSKTTVAKGMFSSAMSLSGTAFNNWAVQNPSYARNWTNKAAARLDCPNTNSRDLIACLRSRNPNFVVAAQMDLFYYLTLPVVMFGPVIEPKNVEGTFITDSPDDLYAKGEVAKIPWIVTSTQNEAAFMFMALRNLLVLDYYYKNLMKLGPSMLDLDRFYPDSYEKLEKMMEFYDVPFTAPPFADSYGQKMLPVFSDRYFQLGIMKSIEHHAKIAPTYSYQYSFNSHIGISSSFQFDPNVYGATHVDDLAVVFNSTHLFEPVDNVNNADRVSEFLTNVITNFARFSKPLYRSQDGSYMIVWNPVSNPKDPHFLEITASGVKMVNGEAVKKRVKFLNSIGVTV